MDNRPIGIFDSGLGGLTAEKELESMMPNESIVYFGDTARIPYGTKSPDVVSKYATQAVSFLKSHDVKAILAACGTISSVGNTAGENSGLTYVNVLSSTAAAAVAATKNKKIGVIATPATIGSKSYIRELTKLDSSLEIFDLATPLLVHTVEAGYVSPDDEMTTMIVRRSIEPVLEKGIDTLILGCTHYPILSPVISKLAGDGVTLINSGREAAKELATRLKESDMLHDDNAATKEFYVTDMTENFSHVAEIFLGHAVEGRKINIEEY